MSLFIAVKNHIAKFIDQQNVKFNKTNTNFFISFDVTFYDPMAT